VQKIKKRKINLPGWTEPLNNSKNRYCIIWGGRGSGKSYAIADCLLLIAYNSKSLILCGREYQNSIKESVYSLLKQRIEDLGFSDNFTVTQDEIRCNHNGSRFIFKGLKQNIDSIKSMTGITHLWIEEGDTLSQESWRIIKPTIREENSQIWVTLNPKNRSDCIYDEFIANIPPANSYVKEVNWRDNDHFPSTLNDERLNDYKKDISLYNHIWEGQLLEHSGAQIFKRDPKLWFIEEIPEDTTIYSYYGLDFGYSIDPTAAIRCYIKENVLYITHEAYKLNLEIDNIGRYCEEKLPGFKTGKIIADSARPETISYMRRQGYNIESAIKGKGSIEDGIAFIRSFDKVIIDPNCHNIIKEFTLYSYKVDIRSGDITRDIVDSYNHGIDSIRYALERIMKRNEADYSILARMR
jgi:phage terminase large subunit